MRIVGYHISDKLVVNSDGERTTEKPLKFLIVPKLNTIRVVDDVNRAFDNLSKWLDFNKDMRSEILETTKLYYQPYHLKYVPDKFFSIKRNTDFAYYSDLSQYSKINENDPMTSAIGAKLIGEQVYGILSELCTDVNSLTNPVKIFETSIIHKLYHEREKSQGLRREIISRILREISIKIVDSDE